MNISWVEAGQIVLLTTLYSLVARTLNIDTIHFNCILSCWARQILVIKRIGAILIWPSTVNVQGLHTGIN